MPRAAGATWPRAATGPRRRVIARATSRRSLRQVEVTRTHLVLAAPEQLRPARRDVPNARFELRSPCTVATYRRLYRDVGDRVYWRDRNEWSDAQLATYLADPAITVWEAMLAD